MKWSKSGYNVELYRVGTNNKLWEKPFTLSGLYRIERISKRIERKIWKLRYIWGHKKNYRLRIEIYEKQEQRGPTATDSY